MANTFKVREQEENRLAALYSYDILGSGLDCELYNIAKLASIIAETYSAVVTFVDRETVVAKAVAGLEVEYRIFDRKNTVVDSMMSTQEVLVINNLKQHPVFVHSPFIKTDAKATFCCGVPLIDADGYMLGALFAVDTKENSISQAKIEGLKNLAAQVITHLSLRRKNIELQEKSLRLNEFFNVFEASTDIHGILNRSGEILYINQAAEAISGYDISEVVGSSLWQHCHKDDVPKVLKLIEEGLKQGKKNFSLDFRLITKSSQIKWLNWSMVSKGDRWYGFGRDITEKKKADLRLNNLNFVANRINNAVVISNAENRVGWVNDAFTKITGYTLQDVQGKPLGDLLSGPDTDWSVIEKARKLTNNKQSFTVELLGYRKNGEKMWLSIHSSIVLDEDGELETEIEIIIDITERKRAELELLTFSTIISNVSTSVVIYDKHMNITWANEAALQLTGYELAEMIGKKPNEFLRSDRTDLDLINKTIAEAGEGKPYRVDIVLAKKDKSDIWVSLSNTPILDRNGEVESFVELATDISERKTFEDNIIAAKEQALQLSQAKEMFLSVMSHELRTPLNAVIGMTHLLLENDPKPSQVDDLNLLKFSGENLLRIVNDVLDFTKIETGNMQLEHIAVDLKALCTDIVSTLQVEAAKRQNQLVLHFDEQIPKQVLSDKTRLYQILMNLLSNALKFTKKGKIGLHLSLIKQDKQQVEVMFQVKDTGIGIPIEKQQYIFDSFTQAGANIARQYGGTGLGLAITKKLVKLLGSDISLESREGHGSNFYFSLVFDTVEKNKKIQDSEDTKLKGKRILIVDDNATNILVAERIMMKWGLDIAYVTDGYQAIEQLKQKDFDLIFMDIHMPGLDGFETTALIRAINTKIPIIALTASTLDSDVNRFEEAGMNGYVFKPFQPSEVKKKIAEFLK